MDRVVRTPPVRPVRRPAGREDTRGDEPTSHERPLDTDDSSAPPRRDPDDHVIDEYLK
ncbi:MAG: hypothetical protein AAFU65_01775 [Pseudomonadota bacterium]